MIIWRLMTASLLLGLMGVFETYMIFDDRNMEIEVRSRIVDKGLIKMCWWGFS
jgi:hypothetical protein